MRCAGRGAAVPPRRTRHSSSSESQCTVDADSMEALPGRLPVRYVRPARVTAP